jgi:AcrR family transcriptional regulator
LTERSVYDCDGRRRNLKRRRNLSEDRRAQILEAAVAVIGERGLCDTRISDIAERVGTSPALIVYYFRTKGRLLADALTFAEDRFYTQTARELETIPDATGKLVRLIEISCSPGEGVEEWLDEWVLWLDLWTRAFRDPEVSAQRQVLDRRWRDTIASIIRDGQSGGEFDPGTGADDLALRLASMIDGLAIQVVLKDPEVSSDRMREICLKLVSDELGFRRPVAIAAPTGAGERRRAPRVPRGAGRDGP